MEETIDVSAYCENQDCRVQIYMITQDAEGTKNSNCPGCGQFGRVKGKQDS